MRRVSGSAPEGTGRTLITLINLKLVVLGYWDVGEGLEEKAVAWGVEKVCDCLFMFPRDSK